MKKYVAVADLFSNQYVGGAELTTDAILSNRLNETIKINSHQITKDFISENSDKIWIIFNFSRLEDDSKVQIIKNVKYSIVEYDYKFCNYRSIEKHLEVTGNKCDCLEDGMSGKIKKLFYGYAEKIWFMSENQRQTFLEKVPTIKEEKTEVLSSVFLDGDLRFIESISGNEKDSNYLILNSNSWIKGTKSCVEYAQRNSLDFELISGLPYHELMIKLSTSKGLIFKPLGGDTCPRIVIEAKLLGCDLILNDNVQHKDEEWFKSIDSCLEYLKNRTNVFWSFYER